MFFFFFYHFHVFDDKKNSANNTGYALSILYDIKSKMFFYLNVALIFYYHLSLPAVYRQNLMTE